MTWEWKQSTASVSIDDIVDVTIKNRLNSAYEATTCSLSMLLYADDPSRPPPTKWERLLSRTRMYWRRANDAWLVLTGKADIGDW